MRTSSRYFAAGDTNLNTGPTPHAHWANPQPSAGIIDSQSVRTTGVGAVRGYDGAKRVNGRKRHILADSLGLVLQAKVHTADIQDRAGVPLLLAGVADRYPPIEHLWVDQGYTGSGKSWIEEHLGWPVEVVRHPPHHPPK